MKKSRLEYHAGKLTKGFQVAVIVDRWKDYKWYFSLALFKFYFELHIYDEPKTFITSSDDLFEKEKM